MSQATRTISQQQSDIRDLNDEAARLRSKVHAIDI